MSLESLGIQLSVLIAQIIWLLILFFAFKFLVWDKLQKAIEDRRNLMTKLEDADREYNRIIEEAKSKADQIFKEAEELKKSLIAEWHKLAEKKQQEILQKAQQEADIILENAKARAEKLWKDLEKEFENSVKTIANKVLKKIINQDKEIKEEYIRQVIWEMK